MVLVARRAARPPLSGWTAAAVPLLLLLVALLTLLPALHARAANEQGQRNPDTSVTDKCNDCGVLRSIREIRTERQIQRPDVYVTSSQYLSTRAAEPPRIGPVISFSWGGRGDATKTQIGAMGSPQMQQRMIDISYELTVRLDDGRYALIEQNDVGDLRIGDRVRVQDKRVVRIK